MARGFDDLDIYFTQSLARYEDTYIPVSNVLLNLECIVQSGIFFPYQLSILIVSVTIT
jgi:hypothetical protein